jgi:hypothetical protein
MLKCLGKAFHNMLSVRCWYALVTGLAILSLFFAASAINMIPEIGGSTIPGGNTTESLAIVKSPAVVLSYLAHGPAMRIRLLVENALEFTRNNTWIVVHISSLHDTQGDQDLDWFIHN